MVMGALILRVDGEKDPGKCYVRVIGRKVQANVCSCYGEKDAGKCYVCVIGRQMQANVTFV